MTDQATQISPGDVLGKLLDAMKTLDQGKLEAIIHPDVVVIEPESLPYGGVYEGRDAFFNDLFPEIAGPFEPNVEDAAIYEREGGAAVNMTVAFTSRRTGKTIRMPYVEVYTVVDGLITRIDVYPQDATALTEFMEAER